MSSGCFTPYPLHSLSCEGSHPGLNHTDQALQAKQPSLWCLPRPPLPLNCSTSLRGCGPSMPTHYGICRRRRSPPSGTTFCLKMLSMIVGRTIGYNFASCFSGMSTVSAISSFADQVSEVLQLSTITHIEQMYQLAGVSFFTNEALCLPSFPGRSLVRTSSYPLSPVCSEAYGDLAPDARLSR